MSCESLSHQSTVNAAIAVLLIRAAFKYGIIKVCCHGNHMLLGLTLWDVYVTVLMRC